MTDEADILKEAIIEIVGMDVGVYPESWEGEYTTRTEYMDGWNAACVAHARQMVEILRRLGIRVTDTVDINGEPHSTPIEGGPLIV